MVVYEKSLAIILFIMLIAGKARNKKANINEKIFGNIFERMNFQKKSSGDKVFSYVGWIVQRKFLKLFDIKNNKYSK